jgi:membrane protein DedA with SNARE-associated domain
VARYGAWAVFVARFVAGLRFLAGPLAGATGLPPLRFVTANVLGALLYTPFAVGLGFAIGYGFGDDIERLLGRVQRIGLVALLVIMVALVALRLFRTRQPAA